MNTRVFLALCSLTVISACSPFVAPPGETVSPAPPPTLIPNQPLTLFAPELPLQVDGLDVPREGDAILLLAAAAADLSNLPEGSRNVPTDTVRAETRLVPVATNDGVLASETGGQVACAVLTSISRRNPDNPDELQTLILDEAASTGNYWVYSLDGAKQYIPKTVTEPGNGLNVYLAVDLHLDGEGGVYFVAIDKDGNLVKVMEAVSAEEEASEWRSVQAGEFGLKGHEALLNVPDLVGDPDEIVWADDKVLGEKARLIGYVFTDENGTHTYSADQIEWLPLGEKSKISEDGNVLGSVVLKNTKGEIEYIWQDGDWQKATIENLSGGASVFVVADRRLIEVGHRLLALDSDKFELGADGENVVVSESGERYTWGENGWTEEISLPDTLVSVQERLGSDFSLQPSEVAEGEAACYEIVDAAGQAVDGVRVLENGDTELTITVSEDEEFKLITGIGAVTSHKGNLVWGLREYINGQWSEPRGKTAAEAVAGFEVDYPYGLEINMGSEKKDQMIETMFAEHERAMAKSEKYDPASEFEGIEVIVNKGTKYEETYSYDEMLPEKWLVAMASGTDFKNSLVYVPKSKNRNVVYGDSRSSLSYAGPIQAALDAPAWTQVKIISGGKMINGKKENKVVPAVLVPVVAINGNGSINLLHAMINKTDFDKIKHLLDRDNRGKINLNYIWIRGRQSYTLTLGGTELMSFVVGINQELLDEIDEPEENVLDERSYVEVLPKALERVILTMTILPQDLQQ